MTRLEKRIFLLPAMLIVLCQSPSYAEQPASQAARPTDANVVAEFCRHLTPAGQKQLGCEPAQLKDDGHELALRLLKPIADCGGVIAPARVEYFVKLAKPNTVAEADEVLAHCVMLLGGLDKQDLGRPIDWFRAPKGDLAWTTHLHRHAWLLPAAYAWRATGQEKYAREVVAVLLEWVGRFPNGAAELDNRDWGYKGVTTKEGLFKDYCDGPWTSLSAHIREESWTAIFQLVYDSPAMTNRAAATLLLSLLDEHRRNMLEYPRGMNQGLGIAFSLSRLGMLYGFYDASADAKRVGYERIETYCRREIYPDGSLAECSFNYNINCLSQLLELADLAARLHLAPPAGLKERLPAAARYMALTTDPLVRAPRLATGGGPIANFLRELNAMAKDPAIAFVASMGKEGTPPPKACATFPWVGCHVFRSGWGKDATWMLFEAGPRGNGHHDIAQLNVQLVSGGQVLLADPGFYTYSSAGEGGRMSEYLHTTAAHNAALVDGLGQIAYPPGSGPAVNERAGKYGWKDQANAAFAEGTYDYGFGEGGKLKVTHHRQVTYAKRANAFVIEDTFGGAGEHEVELHWQLEPKAKVDLAQDVGLAAVFVGRQPMQMTFSSKSKVRLEVFRGQKDPPGGWYSEGYGKLEPAPMIVVKVRGALPLDVMTRIEP